MKITSILIILLLSISIISNLQTIPTINAEERVFLFEGASVIYNVTHVFYFPETSGGTGGNITNLITSYIEVESIDNSNIIINWKDEGNIIWPKSDITGISCLNDEGDEIYRFRGMIPSWGLSGQDILSDRLKTNTANGTLKARDKTITGIEILKFYTARARIIDYPWVVSDKDTYAFYFIDRFEIGDAVRIGKKIHMVGGLMVVDIPILELEGMEVVETPAGERECFYSTYSVQTKVRVLYDDYIATWNGTLYWDSKTGLLIKEIADEEFVGNRISTVRELQDTNVFEKLELEEPIEQTNMTEPIPTIEEEIEPIQNQTEATTPPSQAFQLPTTDLLFVYAIAIVCIAIITRVIIYRWTKKPRSTKNKQTKKKKS